MNYSKKMIKLAIIMAWGMTAFYRVPDRVMAFEPDMVVKIHYESRGKAYPMLQALDIVFEDVQETWARALIKSDQYRILLSLGFEVEVLYKDSRERAAERRESMGEKWMTYSALVTDIQSVASAYPGICRLHTLGQSVQGRTIYAMEITDDPDTDDPSEAEVRIIGNIHGDEYISMELMRLLIHYLTDNYGSISQVTNLVNSREIWIQPSVNPDGHEIGSRYNANGVDLNRNHGYMYATQSGAGSGPFSEQEVRLLREYSLNRNFSMSLTFHGEATYFNYTWNFTGENAWDKTHLQALGNAYNDWNSYTVIEGYDWYQTNGDTNDWSYGCRGDFDITIETPGGFESQIDADWMDNRDAILYIIDQAGYGISGVVTDAVSGDPLEALVTVEQKPIMVYTDPSAGDYHRPLQTGTYNLKVWANGYQTITVTGISVTGGATATQNVQLQPNGEIYAMHVCWNFITSDYRGDASSWYGIWPHQALGPPDNIPGSLGRGCSLVLDMGAGNDITDHSGNDLTVYEADAGDGDEGYSLYGSSSSFQGPWTLIGTGIGTQSFDLSGTGLSSARWFRLVDDANGSYDVMYAGFDLDAVYKINEGTPTPTITPGGPPTETPTASAIPSPTPMPPEILLVDDDQGESYEAYFSTALAGLSLDFDSWEVSTQGSPQAALLNTYQTVIWLTGDDYSSTLTSADETNLASFLNNGGKLFISGQDIGYDLNGNSGSTFLGTYLKAAYAADDTNDTTLSGLDIFAGRSISISGGDGASNQQYPSQINAINGGVNCWSYSTGIYGGVRYTGSYCLVYFAWGFEAISSSADRILIMSDVMSYFSACGSASTPTPSPSPTASPTMTSTVTRTPTVSVTITPTVTSIPTVTRTPTASATATSMPTVSPSPTRTSTGTQTATPTVTTNPTTTHSPSPTGTPQPSSTGTATQTQIPSSTPSTTPTSSPTTAPSSTAAPTATQTPLPVPVENAGSTMFLVLSLTAALLIGRLRR